MAEPLEFTGRVVGIELTDPQQGGPASITVAAYHRLLPDPLVVATFIIDVDKAPKIDESVKLTIAWGDDDEVEG